MVTVKFKSGASQAIRVSDKFYLDNNGDKLTPIKVNEKARDLALDIAGKDYDSYEIAKG